MRSKNTSDAPFLFAFNSEVLCRHSHPFELIQRFATGHKEKIGQDIADIPKLTVDKGKWTLDLSPSALWSHLNHWGIARTPLTVICDESKPLRAMASEFEEGGVAQGAAIYRAKLLHDAKRLGYIFTKPVQFVDSRSHPSIQLADTLASTAVYCYSHGLPDGMAATGEIIDNGMLHDSMFPNIDRVNLDSDQAKIHYVVLCELVAAAERNETGTSIENIFEFSKKYVYSLN